VRCTEAACKLYEHLLSEVAASFVPNSYILFCTGAACKVHEHLLSDFAGIPSVRKHSTVQTCSSEFLNSSFNGAELLYRYLS